MIDFKHTIPKVIFLSTKEPVKNDALLHDANSLGKEDRYTSALSTKEDRYKSALSTKEDRYTSALSTKLMTMKEERIGRKDSKIIVFNLQLGYCSFRKKNHLS